MYWFIYFIHSLFLTTKMEARRMTIKVVAVLEQNRYRIVASTSPSRIEAHAGLFKLLMNKIFDPYLLWPFDKKLISWLVTCVSTRDFTVSIKFYPSELPKNLKEITAKLKNDIEAWKLECNLMHLKNLTNTLPSWFTQWHFCKSVTK